MAENDNPKSLMTTNDNDNDDNVLELCVCTSLKKVE